MYRCVWSVDLGGGSCSRSCRYKSACILRCVVESGSAVIGSGAHMTVVALVDNASGIRKAFMK